MRSTLGGSMLPALSLLFRGGIIFESLLKQIYPGHNTIGQILKSLEFQSDFKGEYSSSATCLKSILKDPNDKIDHSYLTAFTATARLRNTTGHNLVWDDIFNEDKFSRLIEQEINALLYVIEKKYFRLTAVGSTRAF